MNALAGLNYDETIANETDTLGGGAQLRESGVYDMAIKVAYFEKSKGGATGLSLVLEDEAGGQYKETLWATNKEGKNFYVDKVSGEKKYLAGFIHADALCLLAAGTPIGQMQTEQLVLKIYNYDAKAEVPTKVDALKALMGKSIKVAILKQRENKTQKNESTGGYDPINEERHINVIDKIFRASDSKTTAEVRSQAPEAAFMDEWKARWEGKVKDRYKEVTGGAKAGAPRAAGAAPKGSSLFAS